METVLNLVGAFFVFIGASVGRLLLAIGLGLLFFFAFWFQVFRLDLWATPGMWFGAAFCWFGLWLSSVLFDTGKPAKAVALMCSVFLVGITVARILPNTTAGGKTVLAYQDKKNLERATEAVVETIRPFECNRTNADTLSYFGRDGVTGEKVALIHYARDNKTGRVLCFREHGVYDKTGEPVKSVTLDIINDIANQTPPEALKPIPTPEPVQLAVAPVPTTLPTVAVAPMEQPTPEPARVWWVRKNPREYSIPRGETVTVALTEPLDLGERGENFPFTGILMSDVSDRNGVVLAKSGTPVDMMISSLQLDSRSNEVLLELEVTSLTTTGGTSLPVRARQNGPITVRSVRTGMKKNTVKGALIGAAAGGILGALRDGKRGAARDGTIGTVVGGGAGALLTKGQYILPPSQLKMTIEERWTVPRTMLADTQ